MSVIAPIKHKEFVDAILANSDHVSGFHALRAKGTEGLASTAFPSLRNEYWKYTKVSGLLKKEFTTNKIVNPVISKETLEIMGENPRLIFVNGFLNLDLSILPTESGVQVTGLSDMSESNLVKFPVDWESEQEAFTLLNEASFTDGIHISVAKNTKVEAPIFIVHIQNGDKTGTANRNYIELAAGSEATFITVFEGDNEVSFSNQFASYLVGENAHLHAFDYHQNGDQNNFVSAAIAHQYANSHINLGSYIFGGKITRKNIYVSVLGQNCETTINGTYILNDKQTADFRVIVDHKAAHCNSNQTFKGVMSDKATGVFNGKIYVRKDSQLINAFQTNRNILLSDDANAYSRPQLEIYADDVKCSHGSTIGQLDEDALFYLMARGIRRLEAEKMLVSAFVADAIDNVNYEPFQETILASVASKSAKF
ncbi:MAG: Fe-S cluster assembly protein SufD [Salibacteraceae bacterium]|jgi:Fe-S cluster assembly protein SufD